MIETKVPKKARQLVKCFAYALALLMVSGCATAAQLVDHAFAFDMRVDDQDAVVLDYRYGESKTPTASNPEHRRIEGKSLQFTHVRGEMPVGTFIYVKWRSKSTGEIFERTVDLTKRMPSDIKNQTVYFMVRGAHLYVFLIDPEKRSDATTFIAPRKYQGFKTLILYPDNSSK